MRVRMGLAAMAALVLAGCATRLPPVEVTRFHLQQPIASGTVFVEPGLGADGLEQQSYARAVEAELARLGYPSASRESAGYVVAVDVARDTRAGLARRSPVSIGVGGGTGGYGGGGVGVGVGFSLGGGRGETVVTRLAVEMKRRVDSTIVWEGRAELAARAKAPASQPGLAATKLAGALFSDFPGESGRTIAVE